MKTIPIVFNNIIYNIPIVLAERWCEVLTKIEDKLITIQ